AEGVRVMAFSPDGTRLALGMSDSTIWICDMSDIMFGKTREGESLTSEELWKQLCDPDPEHGVRAIFRMRRQPRETIALLGSLLRSRFVRNLEDIPRLVQDL